MFTQSSSAPPAASVRLTARAPGSQHDVCVEVVDWRAGGSAAGALLNDGLPVVHVAAAGATPLRPFVWPSAPGNPAAGTKAKQPPQGPAMLAAWSRPPTRGGAGRRGGGRGRGSRPTGLGPGRTGLQAVPQFTRPLAPRLWAMGERREAALRHFDVQEDDPDIARLLSSKKGWVVMGSADAGGKLHGEALFILAGPQEDLAERPLRCGIYEHGQAVSERFWPKSGDHLDYAYFGVTADARLSRGVAAMVRLFEVGSSLPLYEGLVTWRDPTCVTPCDIGQAIFRGWERQADGHQRLVQGMPEAGQCRLSALVIASHLGPFGGRPSIAFLQGCRAALGRDFGVNSRPPNLHRHDAQAGLEVRYWGDADADHRPHGRGLMLRWRGSSAEGRPATFLCGRFVRGALAHAELYSTPAGTYYAGLVEGGQPQFGRMVDARQPPGTLYEGEFAGGVPHGFGREYSPDGSTYVGEFERGRRHGRGALSRAGDADPGGLGDWNAAYFVAGKPLELPHGGRVEATIDTYVAALLRGAAADASAMLEAWAFLPAPGQRERARGRQARGWTCLHAALRMRAGAVDLRRLVALGSDLEACVEGSGPYTGATPLALAAGYRPDFVAALVGFIGGEKCMMQPASARPTSALLGPAAPPPERDPSHPLEILLAAGADAAAPIPALAAAPASPGVAALSPRQRLMCMAVYAGDPAGLAALLGGQDCRGAGLFIVAGWARHVERPELAAMMQRLIDHVVPVDCCSS